MGHRPPCPSLSGSTSQPVARVACLPHPGGGSGEALGTELSLGHGVRAEGSRDGAQGAPLRLWGYAPLVLAEDVRWASVLLRPRVPPGLCCGPSSQCCRLNQARGWDTGRARRVPGSPFVPAPLRVSWSPRSLAASGTVLFTGVSRLGRGRVLLAILPQVVGLSARRCR